MSSDTEEIPQFLPLLSIPSHFESSEYDEGSEHDTSISTPSTPGTPATPLTQLSSSVSAFAFSDSDSSTTPRSTSDTKSKMKHKQGRRTFRNLRTISGFQGGSTVNFVLRLWAIFDSRGSSPPAPPGSAPMNIITRIVFLGEGANAHYFVLHLQSSVPYSNVQTPDSWIASSFRHLQLLMTSR